MSHHHGIGKMTAPWLEDQLGPQAMGLLRAIKGHLDPQDLMNPGGTLALDLPESRRRRPGAPGEAGQDGQMQV
jgi:alkyldihydroxyacetonephosphate synthase